MIFPKFFASQKTFLNSNIKLNMRFMLQARRNTMKKKTRITDEQIKEEILNMTKKEIERNTKYVIEFEVHQ